MVASIAICALFTGCARQQPAAQPMDTSSYQQDIQKIATTYTSLRKMTDQPVYVNRELAYLCSGVTQAEVEAARKDSGPHANTAVTIYMNDLAAKVFGMPNPTYPVGAIIVKEKKPLAYWSTTRPHTWQQANDGVGGMIKRPAGYDSAHGDWEYFYFEDPQIIESGKITSCVQCHGGAANRDYVFGNWAGQS
jgi:hypothetical protein